MADGSDAAIAVTVFGRAFVKATLRRDAEKRFNVGFRHDSTTGSTHIRTIHPSDVHDERSKLRANDCVVKINDTPVRAYNGRGVLLAEVQNLVASSGETLLLLIERRPQPLVDEDNFNSMGDDSCESDVSDDGGESDDQEHEHEHEHEHESEQEQEQKHSNEQEHSNEQQQRPQQPDKKTKFPFESPTPAQQHTLSKSAPLRLTSGRLSFRAGVTRALSFDRSLQGLRDASTSGASNGSPTALVLSLGRRLARATSFKRQTEDKGQTDTTFASRAQSLVEASTSQPWIEIAPGTVVMAAGHCAPLHRSSTAHMSGPMESTTQPATDNAEAQEKHGLDNEQDNSEQGESEQGEGEHHESDGAEVTSDKDAECSRGASSAAAGRRQLPRRTLGVVLESFRALTAVECSVDEGDVLVLILEGAPGGWVWACTPSSAGLVPRNYVHVLDMSSPGEAAAVRAAPPRHEGDPPDGTTESAPAAVENVSEEQSSKVYESNYDEVARDQPCGVGEPLTDLPVPVPVLEDGPTLRSHGCEAMQPAARTRVATHIDEHADQNGAERGVLQAELQAEPQVKLVGPSLESHVEPRVEPQVVLRANTQTKRHVEQRGATFEDEEPESMSVPPRAATASPDNPWHAFLQAVGLSKKPVETQEEQTSRASLAIYTAVAAANARASKRNAAPVSPTSSEEQVEASGAIRANQVYI